MILQFFVINSKINLRIIISFQVLANSLLFFFKSNPVERLLQSSMIPLILVFIIPFVIVLLPLCFYILMDTFSHNFLPMNCHSSKAIMHDYVIRNIMFCFKYVESIIKKNDSVSNFADDSPFRHHH